MDGGSYTGPAIWIRIQHRFGPRMMEWFSGAVTASVGVVLLAVEPRFSEPLWSVIAQFFTQMQFGILMAVLGAMRLIALFINGARKEVTPQVRQVAAFFGLMVWFCICAGFYASGVRGLWIAFFPWLAIAELTNIHRAAHDQGETQNGRAS